MTTQIPIPLWLAAGSLFLFLISWLSVFLFSFSFRNRENRRETAFQEEMLQGKAKQDLLAELSHEIRTPLYGIIGMAEVACYTKQDPEKMKESLSRIHHTSRYLLSLVNEILDWSKIENKDTKPRAIPFHLNTWLSDLLVMAAPGMEKKGIRFQALVEEGTEKELVGDPLRLNQILYNLLSNAEKYTPEKGQVTLRIQERKESGGNEEKRERKNAIQGEKGKNIWLRFTVSDTGIGMSEAFLQKVFEPYAQEEKEGDPWRKGTGLGLSITKKLVEGMKGEIHVESREGKGSSFTVTLPFQRAKGKEEVNETLRGKRGSLLFSKTKEEKKTEEKKEADLAGMRILLAEDNEINREICAAFLEMAHAKIVCAANGEEAYTLYCKEGPGRFDAVLLDVQMPVYDGYQVAKMIRQTHFDQKKTPIIAMTAHAFREDKERARQAGMDDYITKPIDRKDLYQKLSAYRPKERGKSKIG